ncbi:glycoside hydrolase family 92 protein [Leptobacterium flavescens]|uniref:Glycoside hydrolase family 92 protein n=1 Tax=Leptobacterium flavescens TaxID=472055 RepID=A0A6P0UHF9_9FLAO|nr:GH92 family glycosyl hydrolase [Leptobacterium flavescens]NER12705.1 glycoside hydrolase family 92 protein [Leptobacterium flavescens]
MRPLLSFLLLLAFLTSCTNKTDITPAVKDQALISYVNPFIGTGGHGHTYPGATMPFGMMQLSPDTRLEGWDGCSGYHYSDSYIYGFSHTHLSGTGVSDYGDVLLMPTTEVVFNNGADGNKGYRAHFSHENESASPGYYRVHLDTTDIDVELTVTPRSGMHKYSFASAENQVIILDLEHRDQLMGHQINVLSDQEISGYRNSKAWATDQRLFYHIKFSRPFKKNTGSSEKDPTKMAFEFDNPDNEPIYVSVGISAVDTEGAGKNLQAEIGDKSFAQIKEEAEKKWESQLEKIVIESQDTDYKVNFYTSLYHTMLAPNLYQDVDGRYRGMDLNVHQTSDFDYYTVFSLWDTFRATHPLYTIIEQERTNDFINTFISKYEEGGIMPIWDLAANYTHCMIGYHAVPVIADAYLKGITDYDTEKAFQAMKHSATRDKLGLKAYKDLGYIPVEEESESVSKTLEYAYDDWTIAQMAKAMGKTGDYENFMQRAQFYKNVFDPQTKFMRGRIRNTWFKPFDPYEVNFNYTEANSWQYSFYVPQDINGFMELLGGKAGLEAQLDALFNADNETSGANQADITGLIGQYAHGNEPSHHMAYLYNFVNKPHKTQERVRQILTELYTNAPDGISGNEDCGQMSAWYVLSSLGFYSVTPASNQYIIGAPLFNKATINLENGKTFTIEAVNVSDQNKYIASVSLNGKKLKRTYLYHNEVVDGGALVFEMTDTPSEWGTKEGQEPVTEIKEHQIVAAPYIEKGDIAFKGDTEVVIGNIDPEAEMFFRLNDDEYKKYEGPITLSDASVLHTYAQKDGVKSAEIETEFFKIDPNISITLESEYANRYNGGGDNALIDGIKGTLGFKTGTWQGYHNRDVIATVDLGSEKDVNQISTGFLKDQRSWIFYPTGVEYYISSDGKSFRPVGKVKMNEPTPSDEVEIEKVSVSLDAEKARYVKVIAKKLGVLPEWHLGYSYDGRSWIFIDEIVIN